MKVLSEIASINREQWADLVMNSPKGTIFQMPEMYDSYVQTMGHTPLVVGLEDNGQLVGVILAVILEEKGLKKVFSRRAIIIGGPIVKDDNKDLLTIILKGYNDVIETRAIYTQIRNHYEQLTLNDAYQENGFHFESHLNFLVTLDNDEAMWNRIGKGRIKQIKKAQKNDLYVDVYQSAKITPQLLLDGYHVIEEVYNHAKLPLVNIQLMQAMQQCGALVMFVVRDKDNTMLGCRFGLLFKDSIYGWYAGSYQRYYNLFPNDILIWETLRWGCANGYRIFDYGGAGEPNKPYGVRGFKQQMGGQLVNFGRYEKIHRPLLYRIAVLGFNVLRILKRGL